MYFDPDAGACVTACPAKTPGHTHDRYCKVCVEVDPTKPYWNGSACDACAEKYGGLYWDGTTCVEKCPETAPAAGENNFCRKCSVDDYNDKGNYFDPETSSCVDTCPDKTPKPSDNNICKSCFDINPKYPIFSNNKDCTQCNPNFVHYDGVGDCVKTCPDSAPLLNTTHNYCYPCKESQVYDPKWGNCVSECPSDTPVIDSNRICRKCSEVDPSKPYWRDGQCTTCSIQEPYWDGEAQSCKACEASLGGTFWNGKECTDECPTENFYSSSGTCECKAGLLLLPDQ